ncbi:MAG TPA: FAD-binding oxidoreductase [Candidatus Limnocylindria bacterium]|jgi:ferredoxin-NADP reductase|nr:FAD-binding oxidoreductase [Candidatus Limnocylindria bacterium]
MAKVIAEMLVESVKMELPDVKTVRLKWPDGYEPGDFKTGQFVTLYWPHKPKYKRAYSLSSSALDRGYYEVSIKRDGKMGTSIVDWVDAGDKLFVIPPTGRFLPVFDPPGKHLICVAGGSGVTPFRGFVREATARNLDTKITVLYSVRTTQDIIFFEEFRQLEQQNPRFKFVVTCTRLPAEDPWDGRRGRVTPEWVKTFVTDPAHTVFYACGTNAMVESVEHLVLHDLGLPKEQMKTEKWG